MWIGRLFNGENGEILLIKKLPGVEGVIKRKVRKG